MKCDQCESEGKWYQAWGFWNKDRTKCEVMIPTPRVYFCDSHKPENQPLSVKSPQELQGRLDAQYPGLGLLVETGTVRFVDNP